MLKKLIHSIIKKFGFQHYEDKTCKGWNIKQTLIAFEDETTGKWVIIHYKRHIIHITI